jgi:hypothetical protein
MALGPVASGSVLARVWVPDVSATSNYVVSVTQAAARRTYVQRQIGSYAVTLRRP